MKTWANSLLDDIVSRRSDRNAQYYLANDYPNLFAPVHDYVARRISIEGLYEKKILDIYFSYFAPLLESKHRSGLCLDVGANIGNHSVYFSRYFDTVVSFEPNKAIFGCLTLNASFSYGQSTIVPVNAGISHSTGTGKLLNGQIANLGSNRVLLSQQADNSHDSIKMFSIDDFIGNRYTVDLIKIDIEGGELDAILGATNTLSRDMPILLIEINLSDQSSQNRAVMEHLAHLGYRYFGYVNDRPVGWKKLATSILGFGPLNLQNCLTNTPPLVICSQSYLPKRPYESLLAIPDWAILGSREK